MVSLNREAQAPGPVVTGFSGTSFCVGSEVFEDGLWLAPEWARAWTAATLDAAALEPLLAIDPLPEFLLLGTGDRLVRPDPAFVAAIEARDIGVEAMDSRAAARSWGLLRGEGRWIVAALMPLG
jgi:uncharacterized protein